MNFFNTDFDHPLETVLMHNQETVIPFCAMEIKILNGEKEVVAKVVNNYLTRKIVKPENLLMVNELTISFSNTDKNLSNS